ncbi:SAM-dependent methyltransferase [Nonomuraea fuscirosea]|uniref:SAM-dependent methyltransferase n=1 Tax=Nonomuraea fuscirosea TaxID=1291556 RepID=UPI000D071150|nr:SAM-dependent methyltransferase [Nonomuraea fuscirosea]
MRSVDRPARPPAPSEHGATKNTGESPVAGCLQGLSAVFPAPTQGRVYNFLNGGKDAYAAERALGKALKKIFPGISEVTRENRLCVNERVPGYLAEEGFRQYLDLGCGMPDEPLLHRAVQGVVPGARVAYMDHDPTVLVHARSAYGSWPGLTVVEADVWDIDGLLRHPDLRELIDLDQPAVVVAGAVLHFAPDETVKRVVDDLAAGLAAGSVLVLSHVTDDGVAEEDAAKAKELYEKYVSPIYLRSKEEIQDLLGDRRMIAGLCRTYELLPQHPDDVALARNVEGAPHFYAGIVELSPGPERGMAVSAARREGTATHRRGMR